MYGNRDKDADTNKNYANLTIQPPEKKTAKYEQEGNNKDKVSTTYAKSRQHQNIATSRLAVALVCNSVISPQIGNLQPSTFST